MITLRPSRIWLAAWCIALGVHVTAQSTPDQVTVPFSNPSRPGVLAVQLVEGSITVKAANRKDVLIATRSRSQSANRPSQDAPTTGLRRLTPPAGFQIEEAFNEMTISALHPNRQVNFEIEAPTRTHLKLTTVNSGNIVVEGIDGNLEIGNTNGSITLRDVSGSVVANTTNGNVLVTLLRVTADKAMAFTSLNGRVDVTLPASTKANLKLRSDGGNIYTDFDLVPKTPATPVIEKSGTGGRYQITVNKSIYGSINGGGPDIELRTFNSNVYVRKGK